MMIEKFWETDSSYNMLILMTTEAISKEKDNAEDCRKLSSLHWWNA